MRGRPQRVLAGEAGGGGGDRVAEAAQAAQHQQSQQLGAAVDVVVQRRRAHAEALGEPREHRLLEAFISASSTAASHDLLGVEALARHAQLARAIAASIAASGG